MLIANQRPVIYNISGCGQGFQLKLTNCPSNGTASITIAGRGFGVSGAEVRFMHFISFYLMNFVFSGEVESIELNKLLSASLNSSRP